MKIENKKQVKVESEIKDDSSDSSIDDEDGELLTEELEEGFYKVLSRLKKKDPNLYDENFRFFPTLLSDDASERKNKGGKRARREYKEWLKGQKDKVEDKRIKKDLEALHDYWTNPKLSKGERFLRDYILNKKFLDPDDSFNFEKEMEKLEEEEKEIEEEVKYEQNYNCRFENPDEEFLKNHPHIMKNTLENETDYSGNMEINYDPVLNNKSDSNKISKKRKKKLKDDYGTVVTEEVDNIETNEEITEVVSKKMSKRSHKKKVLEDSMAAESQKKIDVVVNGENYSSPKRKRVLKEKLSEKSPKRKKVSVKKEGRPTVSTIQSLPKEKNTTVEEANENLSVVLKTLISTIQPLTKEKKITVEEANKKLPVILKSLGEILDINQGPSKSVLGMGKKIGKKKRRSKKRPFHLAARKTEKSVNQIHVSNKNETSTEKIQVSFKKEEVRNDKKQILKHRNKKQLKKARMIEEKLAKMKVSLGTLGGKEINGKMKKYKYRKKRSNMIAKIEEAPVKEKECLPSDFKTVVQKEDEGRKVQKRKGGKKMKKQELGQ